MKHIEQKELVQLMAAGQPGDIAQGPDGSLYRWVKGVDGSGTPGGSWEKLRRLELCALTQAPVFTKLEATPTHVVDAAGQDRAGTSTRAYWMPIRLQATARAGVDGPGAFYQAVDGRVYEVTGVKGGEPHEVSEYPAFGILAEMKRVGDELAAYAQSLEEQLHHVGDDAQLANVDLQDALQKQQQVLMMLSNISKLVNDTAMAIIRKIGG